MFRDHPTTIASTIRKRWRRTWKSTPLAHCNQPGMGRLQVARASMRARAKIVNALAFKPKPKFAGVRQSAFWFTSICRPFSSEQRVRLQPCQSIGRSKPLVLLFKFLFPKQPPAAAVAQRRVLFRAGLAANTSRTTSQQTSPKPAIYHWAC